jgi:hypothetical protein
MHAPVSHGGKEELDSKDGRACRRRLRRDDCRDRKLTRRREFSRGDNLLRSRQNRRTGKSRRNNNSRQRWPHGAAVALDGRAGLGHRGAAIVPGLVRMLQADFGRRSQGANQQNSHCRALEDALQHGLSLAR